jgi:short-subunit dehydrogenase
VLVADLRQPNADAAAEVMRDAGFEVTTAPVDVTARDSIHTLVETATGLGNVTGVIQAAGVSPSQAPVEAILAVDLHGTAVLLEAFGAVIAPGGAGVVRRGNALRDGRSSALGRTPRAVEHDQPRHCHHPPRP